MNKTKPPKNRPFLALAENGNYIYWGVFFCATKEEGVTHACYVDSELFDMPPIYGWTELPDIPIVDEMIHVKI